MRKTALYRGLIFMCCQAILVVGVACTSLQSNQALPKTTSTPVDEQVETELGPGNFDLLDISAGLSELSSYRAVLTISFDGTRDSQPESWSRTSEMLRSLEPAAGMLTVTGTLALDERAPIILAELNGTAYDVLADGTCSAQVLIPAESALEVREPALLLQGLFGAEAAGHENMGGIEADHYTFDERALAQSGFTTSSGEVWVASEGGYVVRYVATISGGANYFGEGIEGSQTWDYQLSDIGVPPVFDLPENCPPGLVDTPLMLDAAAVASLPGLLRYESASSVSDIAAFYISELPPLGWVDPSTMNLPEGVSQEEYQQIQETLQSMGLSLPGSQAAPPDQNQTLLAYEQGNQRLSIIIYRVESITKVALSLTNLPQQVP